MWKVFLCFSVLICNWCQIFEVDSCDLSKWRSCSHLTSAHLEVRRGGHLVSSASSGNDHGGGDRLPFREHYTYFVTPFEGSTLEWVLFPYENSNTNEKNLHISKHHITVSTKNPGNQPALNTIGAKPCCHCCHDCWPWDGSSKDDSKVWGNKEGEAGKEEGGDGLKCPDSLTVLHF